jgi:CBS domain-containing protein
MKALDIGPLPVCCEDRLVGMITDRDITVRATAEGYDPRTEQVHDAMTAGIFYCLEDQSVEEAALLMKEKQIRRLPVLNHEKRLVGIVSLGDLAVETATSNWPGVPWRPCPCRPSRSAEWPPLRRWS